MLAQREKTEEVPFEWNQKALREFEKESTENGVLHGIRTLLRFRRLQFLQDGFITLQVGPVCRVETRFHEEC